MLVALLARLCPSIIESLPLRERFHWLTAEPSTIIQTSPVHSGLCDGTDDLLDRLEKQFLVD
jgi:hypothetical protein